MKVSFTNGTITAYGVSPATFTTKKAACQFVIEHSDEFKKGRIKLIREVDIPDEEKPAPQAAPAAKPAAPSMMAKPVEAKAEEKAEKKATEEVKVTCNDDAKDYLAEKFGVSKRSLRSRAIIDDEAEKHGVAFIWE